MFSPAADYKEHESFLLKTLYFRAEKVLVPNLPIREICQHFYPPKCYRFFPKPLRVVHGKLV